MEPANRLKQTREGTTTNTLGEGRKVTSKLCPTASGAQFNFQQDKVGKQINLLGNLDGGIHIS